MQALRSIATPAVQARTSKSAPSAPSTGVTTPVSADAVQFAAVEDALRQHLDTLAQHHRLYTAAPGSSALRPAIALDAMRALRDGIGTLYVVTAHGTTTSNRDNETRQANGFENVQQSVVRNGRTDEVVHVAYSAAEVDDLGYLMSFPLQDRHGRPLEGVPGVILKPGMGTVELSSHHATDDWQGYQFHEYRHNGGTHRREVTQEKESRIERPA